MNSCETERLLFEYLNFSECRKTWEILGEIMDLYGNHSAPSLKLVYSRGLKTPDCDQRHILPVFDMPTYKFSVSLQGDVSDI